MIFEKKFNGKYNDKVVKELMKEYGVSKEIAEFYFSRGVESLPIAREMFNASLDNCHNPYLFKNMQKVVDKIFYHIERKSRILIFGDYDVDGISASSIFYKFFKRKNMDVKVFLPSRFEDGYGLTLESAKKVLEKYNPELLITVDCGITCKNEVDFLMSKGVDVIVTDHHEPSQEIPSCLVLDAKVEGETYPFKELCGAGVAYKVVEAIIDKKYLNEYLPIVAIATISDLVPLKGENRILSTIGLELFKEYAPIGLKEFTKTLKIYDDMSAIDVSYKLAPKLNAPGRFGDAFEALKLYISQDYGQIYATINKLQEFNTNRQDLCNQAFEDCVFKIENDKNFASKHGIVLYGEDFNSGMLGIVSARLVEKYGKPSITFALDEKSGELKGSARSVEGVNIVELFDRVKDLLVTYGGHYMAGGLSIKKENFYLFSQRVEKYLSELNLKNTSVQKKYYDFYVKKSLIDFKFVEDLNRMAPFGMDNDSPTLKVSLRNVELEKMGSHPNFLIGFLDHMSMSFVNFDAKKNYLNMMNFLDKEALVDISIQRFKKKVISYNIKDINYLTINEDLFNSKIKGDKLIRYVEIIEDCKNQKCNFLQLKTNLDWNKLENIKKINKKEISNILKEYLDKGEGLLILTDCSNSKLDFLKNKYFEKTFGKIVSNGKTNTVVYNPISTSGFERYDNILILSAVEDVYLKYLSSILKDKKIFVTDSVESKQAFITRDDMAIVFKTFRNFEKKRIAYTSEYKFYSALKERCHLKDDFQRISYEKFIVAYYSFIELGIMEILEVKGKNLIRINPDIKTNLNDSLMFRLHSN